MCGASVDKVRNGVVITEGTGRKEHSAFAGCRDYAVRYKYRCASKKPCETEGDGIGHY